MKTIFAVALSLLTFVAPTGWADESKEKETVELFRNAGTGGMIDSAHGYAVFPSIRKGGIGIGGAYGKGGVYVGGKRVGLTSMSQVSYGLQLGGQAYSQIIFFRDASAFNDFSSGNFEFGAGQRGGVDCGGLSANLYRRVGFGFCGHRCAFEHRDRIKLRQPQRYGGFHHCQGRSDV